MVLLTLRFMFVFVVDELDFVVEFVERMRVPFLRVRFGPSMQGMKRMDLPATSMLTMVCWTGGRT